MGLIQAAAGAVSTALGDSWRDYFYCDSLSSDVLVSKGVKKAGKKSTNTKGSDNIISNGSIIAVNEGQCMIIVDQGGIVECCAEAGEFLFDSSTEPSLFYGKLGEGIKATWQQFKKRFTFGGETPKDQRIYFINTKEVPGNKYGTANPVPFRVVDEKIGLDVDIAIRCFGEYSFEIADPILFYKNVSGNVTSDYVRGTIDSQLKSELLTALQPAFARISEKGVRYSALPGHTGEIADELNKELSNKWGEQRGLKIVSFGLSSVSASEEDEKMIKELQKTAVYTNPGMAGAALVGAQAAAMQAAAENQNAGPVMAFAGMNMAQQAGGVNAQSLFQMNADQKAQAAAAPAAAAGWKCPACGKEGNTGKFCAECGAAKPVAEEGWTCECGAVNTGKFCSECGKPRPKGAPIYKCDKCGWQPEDPAHPPKFCPECGDPFDADDLV